MQQHQVDKHQPFRFLRSLCTRQKTESFLFVKKTFSMPHQINKKLFQRNSDGSCYKQLTSAETCNRLDIFPFSYSFDIVASIVHPIWRLKFHLIFRHRHFPFDKESEVVIWLLQIKRLLWRICNRQWNPRLPVIDFKTSQTGRHFNWWIEFTRQYFKIVAKFQLRRCKKTSSYQDSRTDVKNTNFSALAVIGVQHSNKSERNENSRRMTLWLYRDISSLRRFQFSVVNCTFAFVICLLFCLDDKIPLRSSNSMLCISYQNVCSFIIPATRDDDLGVRWMWESLQRRSGMAICGVLFTLDFKHKHVPMNSTSSSSFAAQMRSAIDTNLIKWIAVQALNDFW